MGSPGDDESPLGGEDDGNFKDPRSDRTPGNGGLDRERLAGRQSIGTRDRDLLMARQSIGTTSFSSVPS